MNAPATHIEPLSHMGSAYNPKGDARRGTGLIVVVLLHLLIGWALVSGLARKAVEIVKKPIEMKIMEELKLPPPPPPPPKVEKLPELPKVQAPPPPYVPPPDMAPQVQQSAPVIQAVQQEAPKAPVDIAPPPPPPAPAPAAPVVQRAEVAVACPGYQKVLQGALQGAYEQVGTEGTVKVLIRVRGHQVVDVTPQSGPKAYYRLVQAAVRKMSCSASGADELLVPLDVAFREE